MSDLPINISQAKEFLSNFDEDLNITTQLFDDTKKSIEARRFVGHFTASYNDPNCVKHTSDANAAGCGVYFTINETDGKGRSGSNVTKIRCLAVDLDGAPLGPIESCEVPPHYIIESSQGRFQCYWFINPIDISSFSSFEEAKQLFATYQVAMARLFCGDESIKDLPRVLRVPGFWHKKGVPFQTRVHQDNRGLFYDLDYIAGKLGLAQKVEEIKTELRAPLPELGSMVKIPAGARHATLLRYASKYAHSYSLDPSERMFILQGLNNTVCDTPIAQHDLERINTQAGRYAEDERSKVAGVDISAIVNKHRVRAEDVTDVYPLELFDPPGMVGEMFRWIVKTAIKQQPELALAASFAAVATVIGRKVQSPTGLRSNVYFLGLAETGSGKEHPRSCVKRVFAALGKPNRACVESVTSDSAIINAVETTPSQALLFDEFGAFMGAVSSKNAGTHEVAIPTALIKLYTSAGGTFNAKTYADADLNVVIEQPCASMFACSVEANFYKNITKEAVDDGLLNRIIIVKSTDPDPGITKNSDFTPPSDLIAKFRYWEDKPYRKDDANPQAVEVRPTGIITPEKMAILREMRERKDTGEIVEKTSAPEVSMEPDPKKTGVSLGSVEKSAVVPPPEPVRIEFEEGAEDVLDEMEKGFREYRAILRKDGLAGLYSRAYENAVKISLILACSEVELDGQGKGQDWAIRIKIEHTTYAAQFITTTLRIMLREIRKKVSSNRIEAQHKAVLEIIRDAGASGISKKELSHKSRGLGLDTRARDAVLVELQSWNQVVVEKDVTTSDRGTTVYKFLQE